MIATEVPRNRVELAQRIMAVPDPLYRRQLLEAVARKAGVATYPTEKDPLRKFIRRVLPQYQFNWHHDLMIEHLQAVGDHEIQWLMIFMPPRMGKSLTADQLFPAWFLAKYPTKFVGTMSYGTALARRMGEGAQRYYTEAGWELDPRTRGQEYWRTNRYGGMWVAGAGSAKTGFGLDLGIVDDPVSGWSAAMSLNKRDSIENTFDSEFLTRREGTNAAIVLIQTRWHEDDLAGRLLRKEMAGETQRNWTILNLPALKLRSTVSFPSNCYVVPDPREEGEALWPEKRPVKELWADRDANDQVFEALHQQNPVPPKGAFFVTARFNVMEPQEVPEDIAWVRSWDIAHSENKGADFTVGVKVGLDRQNKVYVDLRNTGISRGQWESDIRNQVMRRAADIDGTAVPIIIPRDPGSGKEVVSHIYKKLMGYTVKPVDSIGDKILRADGLETQNRARNVHLIVDETPESQRMLEIFRAEFGHFPRGKNDDIVDAVVYGFNWLAKVVPGPESPIVSRYKTGR